MMATAPTINYPAAHVPASEPQPAINDPHHVDLDLHIVNGSASNDDIENKHITNVDDQLNSADVSVSGGSDNEASRADGTRQQDGDKGHGRTGSSAKKPATFKSVSVNRTFLASKVATSTTSPKPTDKQPLGSSTPPTGSATLSVSRPRLVAKTGSGARDSIPRFSSAVNGGKAPAAPDPSVVWNKNKPIPVPDPKKFTDEELKKYGIHMASRLDEDDTQGQNKWADIDDDDEDWAPDAITWGDGTKTTLPHPDENLPLPPPPPSDSGSVASRGKGQEMPGSPAPPGPVSVSSPLPKPSGLASGKGLVLKSGAQEKPSLVMKPPALPTPAKSPWASLPPVEKASPVTAPETLYVSRGLASQPPPAKGMTPPPKEIAADDFSRSSWRDGASHGNRELFNSQSGRYEPAPDRRGSLRTDQARHPALLQRPTGGDIPAEPSSSFQTNRAAQDVPFGRRRGSSNVSGGSGSYMQRMGKGNDAPMVPPELHGARRTSFAGSVGSPVSPANLPISTQGQARPQPVPGLIPRASPGANFATPHAGPPGPNTGAPPAPPVAAPSQEDDVEFQKKLMRERIELARKRRQDEEAKEEADKKERIQKKLEALGPAPEKKSDKSDSAPKPPAKPTQIQQREQPAAATSPTQSAESRPQVAASASGANPRESSRSNAKSMSPEGGMPPGPASRRLSQGQDGKQPDLWGGSGQRGDRFTSWTSGAPPVSRNVWGSPDNDRGLGNGTFDPNLGRPGSSAPTTLSTSKGPSPIAPPSTVRAPPQGRPEPPPPSAPVGSRTARYGAPGSDLASKWVSAVADNDKKMSASRVAERAERERQLAERGVSLDDVQPTIKDTWRPVHVPGDGTRRSMPPPMDARSQQPGSWKGTRDELTKGPAPKDDTIPSAKAGVIGSGGSSVIAPSGQASSSAQSRASRFFPAKDARNDSHPARPNSPSPPPPTMEGHPVYEGDVMRPHVSLPKPQPVVKLPPSLGGSQSPPQPYQGRASFGWANPTPFRDANRAVSQPQHAAGRPGESSQEDWQNRINNLLNGGKQSPPKAMGVDPASKNALDHAVDHDPATVSLPGTVPTFAPGPQKTPVTKPMAEECFEEQEMGSLPLIKLPHNAPEAAWAPATTTQKPFPKRFLVQATIIEPYSFSAEVVNGNTALKIQFPGMHEARVVSLPFSAARGGRGRSNPRHRGSGQGPRGGKRDSSSTYESHSSSSLGRGGRGGGYRARTSENWNRHAQSQPSLPA